MSNGPLLPQITLPRFGIVKRKWWQFYSISRSCRTFENRTEVPESVFAEASGQAPMLASAVVNN